MAGAESRGAFLAAARRSTLDASGGGFPARPNQLRGEVTRVNIGRPQRIIEVDPVTLPVPEVLPIPLPEPDREPAEPDREPAEPDREPAEPDREPAESAEPPRRA